MSMQSVYVHTCDNCGERVEAECRLPDGWLATLSDNTDYQRSYCGLACAAEGLNGLLTAKDNRT